MSICLDFSRLGSKAVGQSFVPLRTEDFLQDLTALADVCHQKLLEIALRQKDDLTELRVFKTDDLCNTCVDVRHLAR